MRSEVLMVVKIMMMVFWVVTPCGLVGGTSVSEEHTASIFISEDVGSMLLQNADTYLQVHQASQPKRPTLTR
jgi:hypothetical protein